MGMWSFDVHVSFVSTSRSERSEQVHSLRCGSNCWVDIGDRACPLQMCITRLYFERYRSPYFVSVHDVEWCRKMCALPWDVDVDVVGVEKEREDGLASSAAARRMNSRAGLSRSFRRWLWRGSEGAAQSTPKAPAQPRTGFIFGQQQSSQDHLFFLKINTTKFMRLDKDIIFTAGRHGTAHPRPQKT